MQLNVQAPQEEKDRRSAREDAMVQSFQNMTPAQAGAWIDANVNNIATVKVVLKAFAKMLVILARKL